jgi:hypothetical protein
MIESITVASCRNTNDAAAVAVTTSFRPRDREINIAVEPVPAGTVPQLYRPARGQSKPQMDGVQLCNLLIFRVLQACEVPAMGDDRGERHAVPDERKDSSPYRGAQHV